MIEDPQSLYDLMRGEELPNVDTETAEKSEDMGPEQFRDKGF